MTEEIKLIMIKSASSALDYSKKCPGAGVEEIMKHFVEETEETGDMNLAGIAAANFVLKQKEKNPKLTDKKIMQDLTDSMEKILSSIKSQDKEINIGKVFE